MRVNVKEFVGLAAHAFEFPEPVLEIGARPAEGQEEIADLRPLFPGRAYVGSDYQGGVGVDVLLDTHLLGVRGEAVGSVIAMDTAEHVQDPLLMLRDIYRILRPEGVVVMTSHMNFPIHNYPFDYWRYTPAAFDLLVRSFAARAVFYQGNPLAPHTVFAIARKEANVEEAVAFETAVSALLRLWQKETQQAPLMRFEPLREALVHDHDSTAEPRTLAELVEGSSVEQTFVCTSNDLTRIDLKFETHGRVNDRHVSFRLHDETAGRIAAEGEYFEPHMVSEQWVPFQFPPIADSDGHLYRLTLTSRDGRPSIAVSPLLSDDEVTDGERLTENGTPVQASLCIRVLCQTPDYEPPDYRAMAGTKEAVGVERGRPTAANDAVVKEISKRQTEQLSYLFSRLDERLDRVNDRLDALERRQDELLLFVRNLQTSAPARVLRRIGGLLRRR